MGRGGVARVKERAHEKLFGVDYYFFVVGRQSRSWVLVKVHAENCVVSSMHVSAE